MVIPPFSDCAGTSLPSSRFSGPSLALYVSESFSLLQTASCLTCRFFPDILRSPSALPFNLPCCPRCFSQIDHSTVTFRERRYFRQFSRSPGFFESLRLEEDEVTHDHLFHSFSPTTQVLCPESPDRRPRSYN